jgi:transcriptional regulator with XRE-family HTH domain
VNDLAARLKHLRADSGLTLREAERLTGVSRAMLSKIERGVASPTATILGRVAEGYGLSISALVGGPPHPGSIEAADAVVIRRVDQPTFRTDAGFERRSLASHHGVDLASNVLPPGATSGTFPAHPPGTRELLTVARGRLDLHLADRKHELAEGDAISFRGDRDHRFDNPSPAEETTFYLAVVNHQSADIAAVRASRRTP